VKKGNSERRFSLVGWDDKGERGFLMEERTTERRYCCSCALRSSTKSFSLWPTIFFLGKELITDSGRNPRASCLIVGVESCLLFLGDFRKERMKPVDERQEILSNAFQCTTHLPQCRCGFCKPLVFVSVV